MRECLCGCVCVSVYRSFNLDHSANSDKSSFYELNKFLSIFFSNGHNPRKNVKAICSKIGSLLLFKNIRM